MKKRKYQVWLLFTMSNPVDQILDCFKKWEEASDWSKYFSLPNPSTRIWDVSEDIARIFLSVHTSFPQNFLFDFLFFRIYIRKMHPPAVLAALSNGTKSGNAQWYMLKSVLLGSQQFFLVPSSQQLLATSHGLLFRYFPIFSSANKPSKKLCSKVLNI